MTVLDKKFAHLTCRMCGKGCAIHEQPALIDVACPFCGLQGEMVDDHQALVLEEVVADAKKEVSGLEWELDDARSEVDNLERELSKAESEIRTLKAQVDEQLLVTPFGKAPWRVRCACGATVFGEGAWDECKCGQIHVATSRGSA